MQLSDRKKLLIFIVAYHAETTIDKVLKRIPAALDEIYDVEILIIDDGSPDQTFVRSLRTGMESGFPFKVTTLFNPVNQGYGGNQKIGYHYAIENDFDFVALLHGDGQYAPELLPALVQPLRDGLADAVFGSRMLNARDALKGGMPYYKYFGNKILTGMQNRILGMDLSEFHSGYRLYTVDALKSIPFDRNANVFHFDTEIIIQLHLAGKRIVELPIPTYYGDEICRVDGMRYAKDVIRASLQAKLQRAHVFFDRRFDCESMSEGMKYPSKLEFDSTHSRVLDLVPSGSRVLDLGSGYGAVGSALKRKGCYVVGCDLEAGPQTVDFDKFVRADLNASIPDFGEDTYDYVLCLDVIEHLTSPEDFLDELRNLTAKAGAEIILTTANIGFAPMRASLLMGRFEYGKRGILDLTHTRLFTFATMKRCLQAASFDVEGMSGVVMPIPFLLGNSGLGKALMSVNRTLVRLWPKMFAFQILVRARARPTLATLLAAAKATAYEKAKAIAVETETRAA